MPIEDWEKDAAGMLKINPLAAYETAVFQDMALIVRLQFLNPGDRPQKPSGFLQLGISASQLPVLIEDLTRQLGRMAKGSPPGASRN